MPLLTAPLVITYNTTMANLPSGVNRCVGDNVTFTSAPANGYATRVASTTACVNQNVLEALGDLVWLDTNGNGRQDNVGAVGGETPIAGVVVTLLLKGTSTVVATTTTSALGLYQFNRFENGLVAGTAYDIVVDQRSGSDD